MNSLIAVLAASVTTFAVTNIDDIFLLTLFFARRVPPSRIIGGQYLGFGAIIVLSLMGAWAALFIPHGWIRLLGILPLALGVKELVSSRPAQSANQPERKYGLLSVAAITLSNGSDNIGVYVPFFVAGQRNLWVIVVVYFLLIALWCLVGRWLGRHPLILRGVERCGHWAVPLVFIALGLYVLFS